MLRKIRIVLAVLSFIGITLLFAGIGQDWWGWMAKLQFIPTVYRIIGGFTLGNLAVLAGILLVTFLFGRIYCSVICPMGVFQDLVIWLRRQIGLAIARRNAKRIKAAQPVLKPIVKHFSYSPERKYWRNFFLAAAISTALATGQLVISAIAPYSAYGRIVRSIVGLASGESIAPALLITAGVTLVLIFGCAWFWGRNWCNIVCPVGTILGHISRYSLFGIRIDESKCKDCGRCGRGCKSSCIDMDNHTVDYSRCVDCFDCLKRCKEGAVSFGWKSAAGKIAGKADDRSASEAAGKDSAAPKEEEVADNGRRQFIVTAAVLGEAALLGGSAVTAGAQEMKVDGGLADIEPKKSPERATLLVPPGAKGVKDFYDRCTACQLCVSSCPNNVLRASSDLEHLLQPQMGYEHGFCRPECTECSNVCPAGAIRPISREEKAATKIGTAHVNPSLCLAANGEAGCGNCERHCPSGAIRMVKPEGAEHRMPVVTEELCIGCGACEYLCPARPISAITVDGIEIHRKK